MLHKVSMRYVFRLENVELRFIEKNSTFLFLSVKNVQTKVAPMQEVVLQVLVSAVHVREFKIIF